MIRERNVIQVQALAAVSLRAGRRDRHGFSLVEMIVAIALFGVAMSAIGALTFAVTRQATRTEGTVERTAALEARVNDLFSIGWTELPGRVGCTTVTTQPFPRTECITVTDLNASRRRVTLTVTPANTAIQPSAMSVERTRPPATNPFRVLL